MPDLAPAVNTPTNLSRIKTKSVAESLNGILANYFAMYVKTKSFHWHVSGPHFRDYHLLFDDQAAQILATTDAIAERVRKIGHSTLRSISDITRHQTIEDSDVAFISVNDMLVELREDNLKLVAALREAKEIADAAKDNATSGVLDDWTDEAEERAWFLLEAGSDGVSPRRRL